MPKCTLRHWTKNQLNNSPSRSQQFGLLFCSLDSFIEVHYVVRKYFWAICLRYNFFETTAESEGQKWVPTIKFNRPFLKKSAWLGEVILLFTGMFIFHTIFILLFFPCLSVLLNVIVSK